MDWISIIEHRPLVRAGYAKKREGDGACLNQSLSVDAMTGMNIRSKMHYLVIIRKTIVSPAHSMSSPSLAGS